MSDERPSKLAMAFAKEVCGGGHYAPPSHGEVAAALDAFAAEAITVERERLKTALAAISQTCVHAVEGSPRYTPEERQAIAHCLGVIRDGFRRAADNR